MRRWSEAFEQQGHGDQAICEQHGYHSMILRESQRKARRGVDVGLPLPSW